MGELIVQIVTPLEAARSRTRIAGLSLAMRKGYLASERRLIYCKLPGWRGDIARMIYEIQRTPGITAERKA